MPTGYTYPVCEGKITEFPDFALSCARAFGALISMREEPMDAPLPDEIAASTNYYDQKIEESQKRLGEVQAMTNADADAAADAAYGAALKSRDDYLASKRVEAERLNAMLAKVGAWHPPSSDHSEMKKFMIEQLVMSLPGDYAPAIPERLDGATWRKREGDKLAESIVYNQKERDKEVTRAGGRTRWLKELRASLGPRSQAA